MVLVWLIGLVVGRLVVPLCGYPVDECVALDVVLPLWLAELEVCGYPVAECVALDVVFAETETLLLAVAEVTGCECVCVAIVPFSVQRLVNVV